MNKKYLDILWLFQDVIYLFLNQTSDRDSRQTLSKYTFDGTTLLDHIDRMMDESSSKSLLKSMTFVEVLNKFNLIP